MTTLIDERRLKQSYTAHHAFATPDDYVQKHYFIGGMIGSLLLVMEQQGESLDHLSIRVVKVHLPDGTLAVHVALQVAP